MGKLIGPNGQNLENTLGGTGGSTISLTTTGTSGAATLVGTNLNIPNYVSTGGGGSTITADSGLTKILDNIELGGSLLQDTTIIGSNRRFNIQGTKSIELLSGDINYTSYLTQIFSDAYRGTIYNQVSGSTGFSKLEVNNSGVQLQSNGVGGTQSFLNLYKDGNFNISGTGNFTISLLGRTTGAGYVLTDLLGDGNATWQPPSAGGGGGGAFIPLAGTAPLAFISGPLEIRGKEYSGNTGNIWGLVAPGQFGIDRFINNGVGYDPNYQSHESGAFTKYRSGEAGNASTIQNYANTTKVGQYARLVTSSDNYEDYANNYMEAVSANYTTRFSIQRSTGPGSASTLGATLFDNTPGARGLRGLQDFTPNIQTLDYVQKKYVDNLFASGGTAITLTTTGTSGAATLVGTTLNIPNYSTGWSLTGNAGTVPGTNFIGTTDNQSLVFKTDNIERWAIKSTGELYNGVTTPYAKIHIKSSGGFTGGFLIETNAGNDYIAYMLGNQAATGGAGLKLFSGSYTEPLITQGALVLEQSVVNADLVLRSANEILFIGSDMANVFQNYMQIKKGGNIGINTTNPTEKLDVNGNIKTRGNIIIPTGAAAGKVLTSDANGVGSWVTPATGGGGGTTYTGTAPILVSGSVISINDATSTTSGAITAGVQSIGGVKTFIGNITAANLSGTNTGDNATNSQYSGLISNANHTGDATGATVLTLATVNTNVGTFGSPSSVNTITVNGKGLITALLNNPIQITQSQVTNLVSDLANKQATLVSGVNIKTINGNSLLGSGDLIITSGGTVSRFGIEDNTSTVNRIVAMGGNSINLNNISNLNLADSTNVNVTSIATNGISGSGTFGGNTGYNYRLDVGGVTLASPNSVSSSLTTTGLGYANNGNGTILLFPTTSTVISQIKNLPISVNGNFADTSGNITISTGANNTVQVFEVVSGDAIATLVTEYILPPSTITKFEVEAVAIMHNTEGSYSGKKIVTYSVNVANVVSGAVTRIIEAEELVGPGFTNDTYNTATFFLTLDTTTNTIRVWAQSSVGYPMTWKLQIRFLRQVVFLS